LTKSILSNLAQLSSLPELPVRIPRPIRHTAGHGCQAKNGQRDSIDCNLLFSRGLWQVKASRFGVRQNQLWEPQQGDGKVIDCD
jgi:hypothetical protein